MKPLWAEIKQNLLSRNKNNSVFRSWLHCIRPESLKDAGSNIRFTLQVPSDLHKKWIQDNILKDISRYITDFYRKPCAVQFKISAPVLPVPGYLQKIQKGVKKTKNVFLIQNTHSSLLSWERTMSSLTDLAFPRQRGREHSTLCLFAALPDSGKPIF